MTKTIPYGYCHCGCGGKTSIPRWDNNHFGYIGGQPLRFLKGHKTPFRADGRIVSSDYTIDDRGYETPCWIWAWKTRIGAGYARLRLGGKKILAHRAMYEQEVGPIPEGWTIDHLCEQKDCVNPTHIEAVTFQENIRRRDERKRLRSRPGPEPWPELW